jgi:hypothetical protein
MSEISTEYSELIGKFIIKEFNGKKFIGLVTKVSCCKVRFVLKKNKQINDLLLFRLFTKMATEKTCLSLIFVRFLPRDQFQR